MCLGAHHVFLGNVLEQHQCQLIDLFIISAQCMDFQEPSEPRGHSFLIGSVMDFRSSGILGNICVMQICCKTVSFLYNIAIQVIIVI